MADKNLLKTTPARVYFVVHCAGIVQWIVPLLLTEFVRLVKLPVPCGRWGRTARENGKPMEAAII